MIGRKDDQGKLRWGLLLTTLVGPLEEVVRVLMGGADKYGDNNWQLVENGEARYRDALMRHFAEYCRGVTYDAETGRHHLAHVITNGLFLLWLHLQKTVLGGEAAVSDASPLPSKPRSLEDLADPHGLEGR